MKPLTLLYDASCPICALEMDHLRSRDQARRLVFIDIAAPDFDAARWQATAAALNAELHAVLPDGQHLVGMPALRAAYGAVGLGAWLAPTALPGLSPLFDRAYRLFARHRQSLSGLAAPLIAAVRARRVSAAMARCRNGTCHVPKEKAE